MLRDTIIYGYLWMFCPNTSQPSNGAVLGRINKTFGETLSYVLPLFSTLMYIQNLLTRPMFECGGYGKTGIPSHNRTETMNSRWGMARPRL